MKKASKSIDRPVLQEIRTLMDGLNCKHNRDQVLTDIFEMTAIGISNHSDLRPDIWNRREENYKALMERYELKDRLVLVEIFGKLFDLLTGMVDNGFDDYLGKLYMMSGTSNDKAGQFFTPYDVSKMCAQTVVTEEKVEEHKASGEVITITEPACGSGGMLVAALDVLWNEHEFNYASNVYIDCGDVDRRCVYMCYIQLSLAGVPAVVRHTNTLTLEQWDEWHTPALILQWSKFEKYYRGGGKSRQST